MPYGLGHTYFHRLLLLSPQSSRLSRRPETRGCLELSGHPGPASSEASVLLGHKGVAANHLPEGWRWHPQANMRPAPTFPLAYFRASISDEISLKAAWKKTCCISRNKGKYDGNNIGNNAVREGTPPPLRPGGGKSLPMLSSVQTSLKNTSGKRSV